MSWKQLLADGLVVRAETSRQEVDGHRTFIEQSLADARDPALPAERVFVVAYHAVETLAKMAISCAGYRVRGEGMHNATFKALELALGEEVAPLVAYFDHSHRSRDRVTARPRQVEQLVQQVGRLRDIVERWIARHYPDLGAR